MRKMRDWTVCFGALTLLAGTCLAQEAGPQKFFKFEFVVKEVEGGKVLNSRAYSAVVSAEPSPQRACSIRTGSKVPAPSGGSSFTYLDLGVAIDCRAIKEVAGQLAVMIDADISSLVQESTAPGLPPIVRQNKWVSTVIVPLKKPTLVFSSDDATTKRQMQLELTATPIT